MSNKGLYTIQWESPTGAKGNGKPVTEDVGEAWLLELQDNEWGLIHWLVPVEDEAKLAIEAVSLEEAARGTRYGKFRPDCIIM